MNDNLASHHHYLLTALGIRPQETTYALDGRPAVAKHAPLALLRLLEPAYRPDTVLCLLTQTARKEVWPEFCSELEGKDISVRPIDIPDGDEPKQMAEIIQSAASAIEAGSRLTLDVTHGPRHIPFVLYALALYLSSLQRVKIEAAWYGKFESAARIKPLINLRSLLDFPEWFHAAKVFQEAGFTKNLARRFEAVESSLPRGPERGQSKGVSRALRDFSETYESGLPLELGLAAGKVCHALESHSLETMPGLAIPQAAELSDIIREAAKPFRFGHENLRTGKSKGEWKKTVVLTVEELRRQAKLIDHYMKRGQVTLAFSSIREWMVSLGALHRGKPEEWLKRDARIRAEREIGALSQRGLRDHLNEDQKEWGDFWDQLGKQRNQIAHCGMKQEVAKPDLDSIMDFWNRIKNADRAWPSFGGGSGRFLVTPLGMSPGVLYSAIKKTHPASVLALCSEQAREGLERALRQAGFQGPQEALIMEDPFNGWNEIDGLRKRARATLLSADEVLVNLTGGTTMMGIVVQAMFEQARNDQRPCRRFVLTDERPAETQKSDPWVESDLFWLDEDSDEDTDDD